MHNPSLHTLATMLRLLVVQFQLVHHHRMPNAANTETDSLLVQDTECRVKLLCSVRQR